jgi:ubiquinone/menaquinone biosynthesis C-methylase UbiE
MRYDGMTPAEVYDQEVVTNIFSEWTPQLVATGAPAAGERVLDLACGSGSVARAAAPALGPSGAIVGADPNPGMLAVARARGVEGGATVEWVEAPAQHLPLPDDHFDLVLCQQGLQFVPEKEAAAAEIARVLRPGGRLALSVWSGLDANPVQLAYNESLVVHVGAAIFTAPFSFGDPTALRTLLEGVGLVDVTVVEETRHARFDSVRHFAEVHVIGAAAVIPELAALSPEERDRIIEWSTTDLTATAGPYLDGGSFRIPMSSLVATARVSPGR